MARDALLLLIAMLVALTTLSPAQGTELHVSPNGSDGNPGARTSPLRTIQRAADLAQPGDVITVHAGVYRERVSPPRGGSSETKRIVYQAARGEQVEIKGSEVVRNWVHVQSGVWKASVPNSLFGRFNPYSDLIRGDWFDPRGREHHTGAVYLNGQWLIEAAKLSEVMAPPGAAPAWLEQTSDEYLVNIAWMRPDGGPRVLAPAMAVKHGTQNAPCSEGGECVGFIRRGDWVRYEGIDFGARCTDLEIHAASASDGGVIEIHRDTTDGEVLGACVVPNTGGWQSWSTFHARLKPVSGRITVCALFKAARRTALPAPLWYARVDVANTTIWAQFPDVDPNRQLVEINVRQTVFYPEKANCNYITVRGFTMRYAATPWAPPTAEQIGIIGAHWSRGWIIENNTITHSTCAGISLGKYGDRWDNTSANSAEGYVETINRALKNGWTRDAIGHHLVRNNEISDCEQAGIVGSLGAAFSMITGNRIHDIHVRRLFSGAEMAGIKFHGAIDTTIRGNHIYRTCLGLWLDWMAQGTRVSGNVFHDNGLDLFTEVDHGPFLVDNNLFLSSSSYQTISRGGAFAHNLFAGAINVVPYDGRLTPFLRAHSTQVAGYHDNPRGDDRYYNNVFVGAADLSQYDDARLPVWMDGNVFLKGAKPSRHEKDALVRPEFDPGIRVVEGANGLTLRANLDGAWGTLRKRSLVTTALLGRAAIPDLPFEQPDGAPVSITTDLRGKRRSLSNPTVGPLEEPGTGRVTIRIR